MLRKQWGLFWIDKFWSWDILDIKYEPLLKRVKYDNHESEWEK